MIIYFDISFHFILRPIALITLLFLTGCCSYKYDLCDGDKIEASCHPLYRVIPRHRCQIRPYDLGHWSTWLLFGNDDDGIFGEGPKSHYRSCDPPSCGKALRWWCRNPLHNFCFYAIGSAHKENSQFTLLQLSGKGIRCLKYKPCRGEVFASEGSSFFLGFHGWKPFTSLRITYSRNRCFDFYLGWRERGNFGILFKPFSKRRTENERVDR